MEEEVVLSETVDGVTCRWCGHGRGVEVLPAAGGENVPTTGAGDAGRGSAGGVAQR